MKNLSFLPLILFAAAGTEDKSGSGAADGKAADGKAADGKAADGKAADGKAADGKAAKDNEQEAASVPVRVKFLKSPTGAFGLAYNAGEEAEVPSVIADDLIESGYATK